MATGILGATVLTHYLLRGSAGKDETWGPFKDFFYWFLEREKGRGREREISTWEQNMDELSRAQPLRGSSLQTWACVLTGCRTGNPLVHGKMHTGQGWNVRFLIESLLHHYLYVLGCVILSLWALVTSYSQDKKPLAYLTKSLRRSKEPRHRKAFCMP